VSDVAFKAIAFKAIAFSVFVLNLLAVNALELRGFELNKEDDRLWTFDASSGCSATIAS
jgi:hypothetical protein